MFHFFESLIKPFPPAAPIAPPKTLIAFCRHYVKGIEVYLMLLAFLTAGVSFMEVSLFSFLGKMVDYFNNHEPGTLWKDATREWFIMGFVIFVCLPLTVLFRDLILHQTLLSNLSMRIRWQSHRYLLEQSYQFFQDDFAGGISTKVMQTAVAVRETIQKILGIVFYVLISVSSIIILFITIDFRLSIPLIVWVFVYARLLYFFFPRLKRASTLQADSRSDLAGRLADAYSNISTIKLFSHAQFETEYTKKGMVNFLGTSYPRMRLTMAFVYSVWFLNSLLIFSVAAVSVWLWSSLIITTGAIATAVGLVMRLNSMAQWMMRELNQLADQLGVSADGLDILSAPRAVQDIPSAPSLHLKQGNIEFNEVCFHYENTPEVIQHFNLHIKPREKVGIIGCSGAGKSTLVNLLLRFYDVKSGNILIDGHNIAQVQQESLRSHIGMVAQDTSLLNRSMRENLLYGKLDATEEDMIGAAKQAEAHDFIMQLTDSHGRKGYDAHAGERGVKLSGGQRQRIAIARVLIKNAPILILDEATSALDSDVEASIQRNLQTLMQGKTVIAIAHRLSTIAALDRLVVVDKGSIVEQGSHAELIQKNGIYAQLWQRQSGGFLGGSEINGDLQHSSVKYEI